MTPEERAAFTNWFETYVVDPWDALAHDDAAGTPPEAALAVGGAR